MHYFTPEHEEVVTTLFNIISKYMSRKLNESTENIWEIRVTSNPYLKFD